MGCTFSRTDPGVLKAYTRLAYTRFRHRPSSTLYACGCFVLLICVHCRRDVGSPYSSPAFWWTGAIRQAPTLFVDRVSLTMCSDRVNSSSPPECSRGGRECWAMSEWGIGRFIMNSIEYQGNDGINSFLSTVSGRLHHLEWSAKYPGIHTRRVLRALASLPLSGFILSVLNLRLSLVHCPSST